MTREDYECLPHRIIIMRCVRAAPRPAARHSASLRARVRAAARKTTPPPPAPLLRHGESQGNVEKNTYCTQPDHSVPLTEHGRQQAHLTGKHLRAMLEEAHNGPNFNTFFMTSPYARTLETTDAVMEAFECEQVRVHAAREQRGGSVQARPLARSLHGSSGCAALPAVRRSAARRSTVGASNAPPA